ncbi:hypothetical protein CsSME_00018475 [Camellia sinensis var. sinensis]
MTGSTRVPIARLMESGNLAVQDANDEYGHFLWQKTGLERHLSSWKSSDDLALGEFTYQCEPQGYPQNILRSGPNVLFRTGPWNDIKFNGRPSLLSNSIYTFELVYTKEEAHIGVLQCMMWVDLTQQWVIGLTSPTDNYDTYKLCGLNGNCNVGNNPNQTQWGNGDWSNGCVRRTPLDCHNEDGFVKYSGYKMPETRNS